MTINNYLKEDILGPVAMILTGIFLSWIACGDTDNTYSKLYIDTQQVHIQIYEQDLVKVLTLFCQSINS